MTARGLLTSGLMSPGACGVVVKLANEELKEIDCRVVIDGTDKQSFIANKLGLKQVDPDLKKAAFGRITRMRCRARAITKATIIMNTANKEAWFWFIPLSRDHEHRLRVDNDYPLSVETRAGFFEELEQCPGLTSSRQRHPTGRYPHGEGVFYMTKANAGDGWVLVGDKPGSLIQFILGVYFAGNGSKSR